MIEVPEDFAPRSPPLPPRRSSSTARARRIATNTSSGSPRRSARNARKRIGEALEWLAEGKRRNWKYER
jgi:hypothetical protein